MSYVLALGTNLDLSLAEAASQYPNASFTLIGNVLLMESEEKPTLSHLTGCIKVAEVIATVPLADLKPELIADWMALNPRAPGKIIFAVSFMGDRWNQISRFPLECKRIFKERFARPIRWFADADGEASSAAVHKLGLVNEGYEFLVIIKNGTATVAVTSEVQNPDLWTKIDMDRPRRNAKNGMLPPKLAEMLVHLTGSHAKTLLDPFCGSGTVLEAAARNHVPLIYGSDNVPLIVDDAEQNIDWAKQEKLIDADSDIRLAVADATEPLDLPDGSVDTIVSEGYLGRPLQGYEPEIVLEEERRNVEDLWENSLRVWQPALAKNALLIVVWPSYRTSKYETKVDLSDALLSGLGYAREPFELAGKEPTADLMYGREGQHVMRRIVKLRKK